MFSEGANTVCHSQRLRQSGMRRLFRLALLPIVHARTVENQSMARSVFQLVHKKADGRWHFKENAQSFASFGSKVEAEGAGKKRGHDLHARGGDAQRVIHREAGSIETEHTYGLDPRKTAG